MKKFNIATMLVTRSEEGMTIINDEICRTYPAVKREVIDVSGAGDTVVGTFSLCYASGLNVDDCCTISNLAASIVVSKQGTATVSFDELMSITHKNKIVNQNEARVIADILHNNNKKIVFTNGCFDLLHPGHLKSLEESSKLGDYLFVGLNSDASVRKLKGNRRPIIGETDRAHMLSSLDMVDYVIIFDEYTPIKLIESVKPDVLVKGSDYANKKVEGREFIESYGGRVHLIELKEGFSTTKLIDRMRD